jgi:site-specific recombinase XerD
VPDAFNGVRIHQYLVTTRQQSSGRVFCQEDGSSFTHGIVEAAIRFARKRAGLRHVGCHVLRHSFCSHLAMRGAAPKAIQELAGQTTLTMTLRYMHLAPSALREAIGPPQGAAWAIVSAQWPPLQVAVVTSQKRR